MKLMVLKICLRQNGKIEPERKVEEKSGNRTEVAAWRYSIFFIPYAEHIW